MARLTDVLRVRITPELGARLQVEAARLGVREADVIRYTLAAAVANGDRQTNNLREQTGADHDGDASGA